ncbi:MAG TPA: HU family DNA-binding protein [Phycisphaerae bacterium]|nr:HU family DNA-binding protein [Phycisphaerae bacterium]HUU23029.1 HU family DNA-binding protein [Phycisphaerae bacterium]
MTKKEIVRRLAAEMNVDQSLAKKLVQRTLDMILQTTLTEGRIELRNFGVFEIKRRASRKARNPKTNEQVFVPAKSILCFQPGKNVSAAVSRQHPMAPSPGASASPPMPLESS